MSSPRAALSTRAERATTIAALRSYQLTQQVVTAPDLTLSHEEISALCEQIQFEERLDQMKPMTKPVSVPGMPEYCEGSADHEHKPDTDSAVAVNDNGAQVFIEVHCCLCNRLGCIVTILQEQFISENVEWRAKKGATDAS